jgi:hypothetical protein
VLVPENGIGRGEGLTAWSDRSYAHSLWSPEISWEIFSNEPKTWKKNKNRDRVFSKFLSYHLLKYSFKRLKCYCFPGKVQNVSWIVNVVASPHIVLFVFKREYWVNVMRGVNVATRNWCIAPKKSTIHEEGRVYVSQKHFCIECMIPGVIPRNSVKK